MGSSITYQEHHRIDFPTQPLLHPPNKEINPPRLAQATFLGLLGTERILRGFLFQPVLQTCEGGGGRVNGVGVRGERGSGLRAVNGVGVGSVLCVGGGGGRKRGGREVGLKKLEGEGWIGDVRG